MSGRRSFSLFATSTLQSIYAVVASTCGFVGSCHVDVSSRVDSVFRMKYVHASRRAFG